MELTFAEAAKGVDKQLSVNVEDACPRCNGRGSEPGTKVSHCHYCNGTGMVGHTSLPNFLLKSLMPAFSFPQESLHTGPFMMRSACRRCGGKGSIVTTPCALCRGSGQTKKRQTISVPVPAGRCPFWNIAGRWRELIIFLWGVPASYWVVCVSRFVPP